MDLSKKNILVVGDIMLDVYYAGDVERISPEAPVPVFKKKSERYVLGGAANVCANLIAAGQNVALLAVAGNDRGGRALKGLLCEKGIDDTLVVYGVKPTTVKTRFLAAGNQQVLRLDVEDTTPLDQENTRKLLTKLEGRVASFDIVVISDYMKGLLDKDFCQAVIGMARNAGIEVFVDVKDSDASKYRGATLVKPNLNELKLLTSMPVDTYGEILAASKALLGVCNSDYVLSTLGSKGMLLVPKEGREIHIPAAGKEVFDVTGAGDTAISYLAACHANGYSIADSMKLANAASGVQVSKVGTSSVYPEEVQAAIDGVSGISIDEKLLSGIDQLSLVRSGNMGKTIVFANGCFDILHVGHVRYLRQAASLGDLLIVGVNSDSSVRKIKGSSRPINSVNDRVQMLAAFDFIDYVVVFDEETPYEVIKAVQPDVLVKGGDYSIDQIVGRDVVEARGGSVKVIPFVEGKSSTAIIDKILSSGQEEQ